MKLNSWKVWDFYAVYVYLFRVASIVIVFRKFSTNFCRKNTTKNKNKISSIQVAENAKIKLDILVQDQQI